MTTLLITKENKIDTYRKIIEEKILNGSDVFYIMDTETTGLYARGSKYNNYIKDRIIEIGIIVSYRDKNNRLRILKDDEKNDIFFHEYINFLNEDKTELLSYNSCKKISKEIEKITGITESFLNGSNNLNGSDFKLPKTAPTFKMILPFLKKFLLLDRPDLLSKIKLVAHNAEFDYSFINEEMIKENCSPIESYIEKIDTRLLAQTLLSKDDFELFNKKNLLKFEKIKFFLDKSKRKNFYKKIIKKIESKKIKNNYYSNRKEKDIKTIINMENIFDNFDKLLELRKLDKDVKNYSLDHLSKYYKVNIKRDYHGALLDSKILFFVFNKLVNEKKYHAFEKNKKNKIDKNDIKLIKL